MARKIFAAVGGGYASLFTGPARLIEIPVGCASPQALHTAKTSYLGTMVPCHDTLPALPICFSRSKMSRSHLLPVVDDYLHRIGFRNQPAVVTIQTIGPSHDHQPIAWQVRAPVDPLAQMFRKYLPGIRLTSRNSCRSRRSTPLLRKFLLSRRRQGRRETVSGSSRLARS